MKKIVSLAVAVLLLLTLASCARKTKPQINIKHDSVTSIEFISASTSATDPTARSYAMKTVSESDDIEAIICWIEDLDLEKHAAIEVPIENVSHVIVLKGVKDHKLIFMNEYVIYDSNAYTYKKTKQSTQVAQKYNLLNYPETTVTSLGII